MSKTFDPFALEKPVIRLGEHGEWTLADITHSRNERLKAVSKRFEVAADDDGITIGELVEMAIELAEAALADPEGFGAKLRWLCDEQVQGANALGVKAVTGLISYVLEWVADEQSVGEG